MFFLNTSTPLYALLTKISNRPSFSFEICSNNALISSEFSWSTHTGIH
jgi:hypothetical protein